MSTITIAPPPSSLPSSVASVGGADIICLGVLHDALDAPCAVIADAVLVRGVLRPQAELVTALRAMRGNFALIVRDRTGQVLASADKIKSYPISYAQDAQGALHLTWDAASLATVAAPGGLHRVAALEFAMAGYVTGGETLVHGIRQLRGGEALLASASGATIAFDWYHFSDPTPSQRSRADCMEELRVRTRDIFQRLAVRLNGRTAFIPLSGGYDSRLVLTMLRAVGYDRIQTFSYGMPGNCEAAAARVIAERVGVPWVFVPYSRALGRAAYQSPERARYFAYAHQLAAIPMMTDFYALWDLARRRVLPEDAVIINGQTGDFISGGHVPVACMEPMVTRRAFLDAVLAKHFSLWANLRTPAHDACIEERIVGMLPAPLPERMASDDAVRRNMLWEWRARQCEHVVAGQRVYDFFGLSWELPLWDDAYLTFWATVPSAMLFQQSLYRDYLRQHDPFRVFQMPFPRYTPPRVLVPVSAFLKFFGARGDVLRRQYLHYWQKYSYFYAIYPYHEYRRFAAVHRSPSACLARDVLRETHGMRLDAFVQSS